jgi:hypothetical protein
MSFLWLSVLTRVAVAEPIPVRIPETTSLFQEIRELDLVGSAEVGNCMGAIDDAVAKGLEKMAAAGLTVIVGVFEKETWNPIDALTCEEGGRKRKPRSLARLRLLATMPGTQSAYPLISSTRAVEIAQVLESVTRLKRVKLIDIGEGVFLDFGVSKLSGKLNTIILDRNARGVWAFETGVRSWLKDWTKLAEVPEISGAVVGYKVASINFVTETSKSTELFRFAITTLAAQQFINGKITDQELVDQATILYASKPRGDQAPIQLDIVKGAY